VRGRGDEAEILTRNDDAQAPIESKITSGESPLVISNPLNHREIAITLVTRSYTKSALESRLFLSSCRDVPVERLCKIGRVTEKGDIKPRFGIRGCIRKPSPAYCLQLSLALSVNAQPSYLLGE
jgi:hypothetical protein